MVSCSEGDRRLCGELSCMPSFRTEQPLCWWILGPHASVVDISLSPHRCRSGASVLPPRIGDSGVRSRREGLLNQSRGASIGGWQGLEPGP